MNTAVDASAAGTSVLTRRSQDTLKTPLTSLPPELSLVTCFLGLTLGMIQVHKFPCKTTKVLRIETELRRPEAPH